MGLTGSWEEGGAYLDLLRRKKINCICIGTTVEMGVAAIPIPVDT